MKWTILCPCLFVTYWISSTKTTHIELHQNKGPNLNNFYAYLPWHSKHTYFCVWIARDLGCLIWNFVTSYPVEALYWVENVMNTFIHTSFYVPDYMYMLFAIWHVVGYHGWSFSSTHKKRRMSNIGKVPWLENRKQTKSELKKSASQGFKKEWMK